MLSARERTLFFHLWQDGQESRLKLAKRLGLTPNAAGDTVFALLKRKIVRECAPAGKGRGRGRPSVPIEIDTTRRHILGMALQHGAIEVARLNLRGQLIDTPERTLIPDASSLVRNGVRILNKAIAADTLAIGITSPGFIDLEHRRLLISSALDGLPDADLAPLYKAAGSVKLFIHNDMHAMAARWLLTCNAPVNEDSLLVLLADNQIGAAVLVNGRPNTGCVTGANELGHIRLPLPTEMCYCGHSGCLERIFSSNYIKTHLHLTGSLSDEIRAYTGRGLPPLVIPCRGGRSTRAYTDRTSSLTTLIDLTASTLASTMNLLRPHRLVIASPFTQHAIFANDLLRRTREYLLPGLSDRIRIDLWEQAAASPAESAGFLPIAAMCLDSWA